jgi:hypothetical protein
MIITMELTDRESNLILSNDAAVVSVTELRELSKFLKSVLSEDDFKLLKSEYQINYRTMHQTT